LDPSRCGARDLEYVRELGAYAVLDYRETRFKDVVPTPDMVVDTVRWRPAHPVHWSLRPGGV
jgi:hypothetical protein